MEPPHVIAIHGVGNHEPGQIASDVRNAFALASMTADVTEFNWDVFADHSVVRIRDGVALLDEAAQSISNAAALPL